MDAIYRTVAIVIHVAYFEPLIVSISKRQAYSLFGGPCLDLWLDVLFRQVLQKLGVRLRGLPGLVEKLRLFASGAVAKFSREL